MGMTIKGLTQALIQGLISYQDVRCYEQSDKHSGNTHFLELDLPCTTLTLQSPPITALPISLRSLSPCCWRRGQFQRLFQHSWKALYWESHPQLKPARALRQLHSAANGNAAPDDEAASAEM